MQVSPTLLKAEAKSKMIFAFDLYLEEKNLDKVKGMYPDQYEFVLQHQHLSFLQFREIVNNLFNGQTASSNVR